MSTQNAKAVPCNLKEGATMLGGSLDGRGFGENEHMHMYG